MQKVESNVTIKVPQLSHVKEIQTNYTGIIHIDWKLHTLWFLAIVCFILSRLWWLVPLPGDSLFPGYRTYPATFLNNMFLVLACGLASRSLPIGLINKPFTNGIHPESVIAYGSTGGYAAMWSGIRHKSGIRYFFLAFLVTAATLLGNALEGELQSSISVHYKTSGSLTNIKAFECQHNASSDYQAASNAKISHTLSDVPSNLLQNTSGVYSLSIYETVITPIHNISFNTNSLQKRHLKTISCEEASTYTATSTSNLISVTISSTSPSSTLSSTPSNEPHTYAALTLNGQAYDFNSSDFTNATLLSVSRNNTAYTSASVNDSNAILLNVARYTFNGAEAILIYSDASHGIVSGAYVSGQTTNYTCELGSCYPSTTQTIENSRVVADALVQSIQSNTGYFGTSLPNTLVLNLLNHEDVRTDLVDALFMNADCPATSTTSAQAHLVLPYTSAHWTILGIFWAALYAPLYGIGAYLIGYTESSWSELTLTGYMLPQVIHNSNDLCVDGIAIDQTTYLDPTTGKFSFAPGYKVTSEEVGPY